MIYLPKRTLIQGAARFYEHYIGTAITKKYAVYEAILEDEGWGWGVYLLQNCILEKICCKVLRNGFTRHFRDIVFSFFFRTQRLLCLRKSTPPVSKKMENPSTSQSNLDRHKPWWTFVWYTLPLVPSCIKHWPTRLMWNTRDLVKI